VRIISGRLRGKKIIAPQTLPVRPTTDFAKTGLFNILSNRISWPNTTALDLFAGTGNISYEMISRGVANITAVDLDKRCVAFIQKTFDDIHAINTSVIHSDALEFLDQCTSTFDLIFADPPFAESPVNDLVSLVFNKKLLRKNGLLVIEHSSDMSFTIPEYIPEKRTYGAVSFSIFVAEK
jgi:16S rRNA (guanine966-N2)-methyltransferase